MNLKDLVAVSGMPGIYRMAANRNNGLIIEDLDTGKRKFAPARKHQFTPLESIAIFTMEQDSIELGKVFQNMLDQLDDNPPVSANGEAAVLQEYFADVLPDYDRERVNLSDIKKVIRWFGYLQERGYLTMPDDADSEEE